MKRIFYLFAISLMCSSLNAQDYSTALGFRFGTSNGVTVKHMLGTKTAIEGILSSRWRGFNITGLFEVHAQAFEVPGLNWYYGGGGHVGFWSGYDKHPWFDDNGDYVVIGVDGILGMEYNIQEIPLNLSVDWKPAINLVGISGFWGDSGAFSVRYRF